MESLSLQIHDSTCSSNAVSLLGAMITDLHLITIQGFKPMKQKHYVSSIDSILSQNPEAREFINMEHTTLQMDEVIGLWKYDCEKTGIKVR